MSPTAPIPEPESTRPPGSPTPTAHGPRAGPVSVPAGHPIASRPEADGAPAEAGAAATPRRLRRQRPAAGRRLARPEEMANIPLTPEQRLLVLDSWRRSGLPAGDFAPLVGSSKHTLYAWKHKFELEGPAGLLDHPRGSPTGSRLPEVTRRALLMLKESNPDWGRERIAAMLLRGPALPASPDAVARVLREAPSGAGKRTDGGATCRCAGAAGRHTAPGVPYAGACCM